MQNFPSFFVENEIRKLFQCGGHKNGTEEITVEINGLQGGRYQRD